MTGWLRGTPVLAVALLLGACAPGPGPAAGSSSAPERPTPSGSNPSPVPTPTPTPVADGSAERLAAEFAALSRELPGRVGLAVAPVGGGRAIHTGAWRSGVAWSTSKVPLAIAATGHAPGAGTRGVVRRAITSSDNEAAEQLWQSLGPPATAAAATGLVIEEFGAGRVRVESQVLRPGFSAYGQTEWSLASQAEFAAALPCRVEAREVYALMAETDSEQWWGVAGLPGAHLKGGWGPGSGGGYLVRQLGVIDTTDGRVAVALAAEPASGAYADGTRMLTRIGDWLATRSELLPDGECRG